MTSQTFQLHTPTCADCSDRIVDAVKSLAGVNDVTVDTRANTVTVDCSSSDCAHDTVRQAIEKAGFKLAD